MYFSVEYMSSSRFFTGAPTIISQDMDGYFYKWLEFSKLEKYYWFFNSLSYKDIENLNEYNINSFIIKVNQQNISQSDQKKLCGMTRYFRSRPDKIKFLNTVSNFAQQGLLLISHILDINLLNI